MADHLHAELVAVVGEQAVRADAATLDRVNRDWTGRHRGRARLVVHPATVAEVAGIIERCRHHRAPLVPIGGNTGLVGGTAGPTGAVALSCERFDRVTDVDERAGQLTAGAGVTLARVQAAARAAGWRYPIDFGARDGATVGGTVATNAGGVHVLRHGTTRDRLLGVEAVLGTGTVVRRLGGMVKDNTGYDLGGLLCGSEGTLGVVTAARLRLAPDPPVRVTALVGFDELSPAVEAGHDLVRTVAEVEAVELLPGDTLGLAVEQLGLPEPPVDGPAVLLVEAAGDRGLDEPLEAALAAGPQPSGAAVATDPTGRRRLWRYREAVPEAINGLGAPLKLDLSLPTGALTGFIERVGAIVAEVAPEARTWSFGHLADGNLHVNVTGLSTATGVSTEDEASTEVEGAVLDLVVEVGGAISAEHGVGRAKAPYLARDRTEGDLATFAAIKAALDPDGIMNPGVLVPPQPG